MLSRNFASMQMFFYLILQILSSFLWLDTFAIHYTYRINTYVIKNINAV